MFNLFNVTFKNIKLVFRPLLLVLCFSSLSIYSQNKEPLKVLFVGNSFMHYWNMPQLVDAIGDDQGIPFEIRQSTAGGSNLKQHWHEENETTTRQLLRNHKWDYVVFGDHSLSTIDHPDRFFNYGEKFAKLVRSYGAEPVFFITWSYKSDPSMQSTVTDAYIKLAKKTHAKVIPVGPIWAKIRKYNPRFELYSDNKHPSSNGSYLIALITYRSLTGKTVINISNKVTTLDKDGEKLYLSFISPQIGNFLRNQVEKTNFKAYQRK